MSINYLIGSTLLVWLACDLYTGKVYLHRRYERSYEPIAYWLISALWLVVAASCFIV